MDIEEDLISWYVDGKPYGSSQAGRSAVFDLQRFDQPMFMLLNLAVGDNGGAADDNGLSC